jgi:hypothetical protein
MSASEVRNMSEVTLILKVDIPDELLDYFGAERLFYLMEDLVRNDGLDLLEEVKDEEDFEEDPA